MSNDYPTKNRKIIFMRLGFVTNILNFKLAIIPIASVNIKLITSAASGSGSSGVSMPFTSAGIGQNRIAAGNKITRRRRLQSLISVLSDCERNDFPVIRGIKSIDSGIGNMLFVFAGTTLATAKSHYGANNGICSRIAVIRLGTANPGAYRNCAQVSLNVDISFKTCSRAAALSVAEVTISATATAGTLSSNIINTFFKDNGS